MYAPYSRRVRRRSAWPIRPAPLVLFLAVALLGVAGFGLLTSRAGRPEPTLAADVPLVGAAAACVAAIVTGLLLYRTALGTDPAKGRAALWFAAPTAVITATGLALLVGAGAGVSTVDLGAWVAAGLVASVLAAVPALLLVGGPATSTLTRVRLGLDAASAGICLMFTCWALVVAPRGLPESPVFWVVLVGCAGLAIAFVTAVRARTDRGAVAACAGGAAAALLGLGGLAGALEDSAGTGWATLFGGVLVAGLAALAHGCARLGAGDTTPVNDRAGGPASAGQPPSRSSAPVFAIPAAVALIVALHRVVTGHEIDRAGVLLGLLSIGLVGAGQILAHREAATAGAHLPAAQLPIVAGEPGTAAGPTPDRPVTLSPPPITHSCDESTTGDANRTGAAEGNMPLAAAQPSTATTDAAQPCPHPRVWATVDPVTGLASRRELWLSVSATRYATRGRGALLAVGLREADGLAGHGPSGAVPGEEALVAAVARVRRLLGEDDLPARLAADEIAVLTRSNLVHAYGLASRLLTALAEPIDLPDGRSTRLSVCIGMTDLPGASGADDVLRRADLALNRARQLGSGRVEWYDAAVEQAMVRRALLRNELPGALQRRELDLIYQPIMDLVRGRPLAVEALLRWRHPQLGTLLPADVIPVAEELGLMDEVGQWVLRQASGQLASWLKEGRNLAMAVNVSPRQLDTAGLAREVRAVLASHALAADRLVLELAETGLDDGAGLADRVGALHALGVRTALDEFGTGSASLGFLRRLPIDMVKIGRPFFDDPDTAPAGTPLIDVMVGVGRRLGIDVVAHGMEAPAHLAVVREAGCRLGQGHLFAHPQPAERTEAYLDGFRAVSR